jgi:hypothetical protein
MGHELAGWDRAIEAWRWLLRNKRLTNCIIESPELAGGRRIAAFGATVFVSRAFADAEIAEPRPGTTARMIESIAAGRPVVLSKPQVRAANTRGGLDLLALYSTWRKGLPPGQVTQVRVLLAEIGLMQHAGYRLRRVLQELPDSSHIQAAREWRVFRFLEYRKLPQAASRNPSNPDRALAVAEMEDALSNPGSVAAMLFNYREPVLKLRESHQALLEAALGGLTDEELAATLGLKIAAVKKRWASVFQHIAQVKPGLLPKLIESGAADKRGRQKRHHLLAHLRDHKEELRPFLY